jgi:hypothetical protein
MSNKVDLRLDWCSYEAAKYAVEHWHYSRAMPVGKLVKVGAWEDGRYIGCVIFGRGANNHIGNPYGLQQTEICELVRVALTKHKSEVSKIVSVSLKMLKKILKLRLVVSYADADQEHLGGIYKASNWVYVGLLNEGSKSALVVKGKKTHPKSIYSLGVIRSLEEVRKHLDPNASLFITKGKHKYLYPLDDAMRAQILPLAKPYPKRGTGEIDNARQSNAETEGASPIVPLVKIKRLSNGSNQSLVSGQKKPRRSANRMGFKRVR